MPSNSAPSYYQWAAERPVTTNQTYGYFLRDSMDTSAKEAKKSSGPYTYTRPFSNSGFFPEIAYKGRENPATKPRPLRPSKDYHPPSSINRFDINKGYSMGYDPIYERVLKRYPPSGHIISRSVTAPDAYRYPVPKGKDMFLWHTLAGTLVHVKNFPPPTPVGEDAEMAVAAS